MLFPVVLAAALMNAAMIAASAVSTILAADELGSSLAGVPNTAGVLGTAAGAIAVGRWTTRLGRAHALRLGYGVGVAGAALTVVAAVGAPVVLLFVGMFLLGAGNAASLLSRYAAGEAVPEARRASAMSAVVWASTAGAAGGPFLMPRPNPSLPASGCPRSPVLSCSPSPPCSAPCSRRRTSGPSASPTSPRRLGTNSPAHPVVRRSS